MGTYTPTPLDTSPSPGPYPMSSVVPDGTNTPIPLEGGPSVANSGNPVAPASMYVKDGNDLTQGAQADAAVINPASSGSVIALLKGLLTELVDIEAQTTLTPTVSGTVTANAGTNLNTSLLALEAGGNLASLVTNTADLLADGDNLASILTQVTNHTETNSAAILALLDVGQEVMAQSLSVAIASDQTVPISHTTVVLLNLASLARATYTSGAIAVGTYVELAFDVNVTALTGGASPTVKFRLGRIGADGILYNLYNPATISAAGSFTTSIGSGLTTAMSFGNSIQIDMVVTGAPSTITFSLSLIAK